ncbi:MAG: DedA family protein, partial [Gallionellaceae bacterium]|nr:DedA family protein [Gallionellaceae bacterium]
MDTFNHLFTSDLSLWGLFFSSFLSATVLPGSSELVLVGVLKLHP